MNEKARGYFLPFYIKRQDGTVGFDIDDDADKKSLFKDICSIVSRIKKVKKEETEAEEVEEVEEEETEEEKWSFGSTASMNSWMFGRTSSNTDENEDEEEKQTQIYNKQKFEKESKKLKEDFGDNIISFSGATDNYWKDLEPKGRKYMILSIGRGDFVRSAGVVNGDLDYKDVNDKFVIVNGIDYKSNSNTRTLIYMEV